MKKDHARYARLLWYEMMNAVIILDPARNQIFLHPNDG